MSGIAGQFFKQFGITVSVQVFFSLLAARFVTPMLAAYFLQGSRTHEEQPPGRILQAYTRLVTWSVRHYFITVLIGLVHLRRLDLEHHAAAARLPAGAGHRALAARDRAAAGLAARRHREGDRGNRRRACASGPRSRASSSTAAGCRRARSEVRRAALIINYTPKSRSHDHPARARTRDRPANSKTFPTSATGSSTKTACARSRWS